MKIELACLALLLVFPSNGSRARVARDVVEKFNDLTEETSGPDAMKGIIAGDNGGLFGQFVAKLVQDQIAISGEVCAKEYSRSFDCEWTKNYNCENQPPSPNGEASPDGSLAFLCCCMGGLWNLDEPRWIPIDSGKACEDSFPSLVPLPVSVPAVPLVPNPFGGGGMKASPRLEGSDYLPEGNRSLYDCKRKCDSTPFCHAIDYYEATGWCNLYEVGCTNPSNAGQGASSYRKAEYIMRSDGVNTPEIEVNVKGKACEENDEHVTRLYGITIGSGGLEACKVRCLESSHCSAFDYFEATGYCNLYAIPCDTPTLEKDGGSSYKRLPVFDQTSSWLSNMGSFMGQKSSCVVGLLGQMNVCVEASMNIEQFPFQSICHGTEASEALAGAVGMAVGATLKPISMTNGVKAGLQCQEGHYGGQGYECSYDEVRECFMHVLDFVPGNQVLKAAAGTMHFYVAKSGPVCSPDLMNPCKTMGLMGFGGNGDGDDKDTDSTSQ